MALATTLVGCNSGDKAATATTETPTSAAPADTAATLATPAHAQLVAGHQQEVAAAKAAGKANPPEFAALEKRHTEIITRHLLAARF